MVNVSFARIPVLIRILTIFLALNIFVIIFLIVYTKLLNPEIDDFCEWYKRNGDWNAAWPYNMHNVSTSLRWPSGQPEHGKDNHVTNIANKEHTNECIEESVQDSYQLYCDKDCRRFRKLLLAWPKDRPKAVIYFLIHKTETRLLSILSQLDEFFNDEFRYPVVIFADHEITTKEKVQSIRSMTNSMIFMQTVTFDIRVYNGDLEIPETACSKPIGYRHMCRFQAKAVYEQPIFERVDYAWRLDDDSELLERVGYDVFEFMRSRNLTYGYYARIRDNANCVSYLWESTCRYISEEHIRTEFFSQWKHTYMYYNNFEISALSLWRSCAYKNFINYIDRLGGIYYYRWGDAPIKSIALSIMTPLRQIHHFKDIAYQHQGLRN